MTHSGSPPAATPRRLELGPTFQSQPASPVILWPFPIGRASRRRGRWLSAANRRRRAGGGWPWQSPLLLLSIAPGRNRQGHANTSLRHRRATVQWPFRSLLQTYPIVSGRGRRARGATSSCVRGEPDQWPWRSRRWLPPIAADESEQTPDRTRPPSRTISTRWLSCTRRRPAWQSRRIGPDLATWRQRSLPDGGQPGPATRHRPPASARSSG